GSSLAFVQHGQFLAFVGTDGAVNGWHLAGRKAHEILPSRPLSSRQPENSVAWQTRAIRLAAGKECRLVAMYVDGTVRLWDGQGSHEQSVRATPASWGISPLAVRADGNLLAILDPVGQVVRLWDPERAAACGEVPCPGSESLA